MYFKIFNFLQQWVESRLHYIHGIHTYPEIKVNPIMIMDNVMKVKYTFSDLNIYSGRIAKRHFSSMLQTLNNSSLQ